MPKSDSSNPIDESPTHGSRHRPDWLAALACFVLGSYLTVALIAYSPAQSTFVSTQPILRNPVGRAGANAVWLLLDTLGASTWLIPIGLFFMLWVAIQNARRFVATRVVAILAAVLAASGLLAMIESFRPSDYFPQSLGGLVGSLIYRKLLSDVLGPFGSGLLLAIIYCLALAFVLTKDVGGELEKLMLALAAWRKQRAERRAELAAARTRERQEQAAERMNRRSAAGGGNADSDEPDPGPKKKDKDAGKDKDKDKDKGAPVGPAEGGRKVFAPKAGDDPGPKPGARSAAAASPATTPKGGIELTIVKPEETRKVRGGIPESVSGYKFPPLALLKEKALPPAGNSEEEHRRNAEDLLRILAEFGVEVTLGEIHVGPVITRYEVVPAPGVRVEKIAGLDKNIALGMRAQSVRILAPIPGKAAVGVEVPNQHPTPVGMRELIESEDWASSKAELPIALGKDVSGRPLVSDLAKMPHLLIAGATGSGKSVCINSIIASLLYSKSPSDVRLIMVDPKVVELKIFNVLPHMFIPVVTEPKKVPAALKWLLSEMEQRYQIFAKVNVRNIVGFNSRKKAPRGSPEAEPQGTLQGVDPLLAGADAIEIPERLPYIIAIIDELADLMMVAPAEIETCIARLAQLARAAGIHLIIATQRPSVNVITGIIKANLPSRIAFQVASQVDSRTILDTKGADTLIGRGDMLFSPPGSSRLVRAQGAFVSDEEIQGIVDYLKANNPPPVYAQAVQQQIDRAASEDEEGEDGEDDADLGDDEGLYAQALDVLKSTRRASTSMIQRRLRIGYNRAARIMDLMEEKGIVGPENGSSPRDILVDLDKL